MKIRNAALAAVGLLFCALTSHAQITALEGYVKGTDGKPLNNAQIAIDRLDIKGHWTCKTDKKGHYIYTGLQMGMYTISLMVDGKVADAVKNVRSRPGDPTVNNFDLSKLQESQAATRELQQKALETGQIPKELEQGLTPAQAAALKKQIEEQASKMKGRAALNKAFNEGTTAKDAADAAMAERQKALVANNTDEAAKQMALAAQQYSAAVTSFTEASTLDPAQIAVWNSLAATYLGLAKTKTGDEFAAATQKGIETYQKSIELKPDDAGIHNNLGLALAQAKKLPEAQAELEKAVALEPTAACKYYFNLGAVEANAHQDEAATVAFQKAVAGDPKCAEAYFQLGNSLMMKATTAPDGTVTPAPGTVEAFQKYLEVAPTGPSAEGAKAMIAALGSKVETNYVDPKAKKAPAAKTKK
jgi:tetratricopeptide (TPR) repeat protein